MAVHSRLGLLGLAAGALVVIVLISVVTIALRISASHNTSPGIAASTAVLSTRPAPSTPPQPVTNGTGQSARTRATEASTRAPSSVPNTALLVDGVRAPAGADYTKAYVNGPTSAEFGRNVLEKYGPIARGQGESTVELDVHSPVTGKNYRMTCTNGGKIVSCTGGNNAQVFLTR